MRTREKLMALRNRMAAQGVAAVIVPSTDPHQSEYVGPHWQARKWLSGFTGSAGTLVVTARRAGLWTDGRYFIQAGSELGGSGIRLFKSRDPGVPTVNEWVAAAVPRGATVAVDGRLFSMEAVREMRNVFAGRGVKLTFTGDLVGEIWTDRPAPTHEPAFDFPVRYAGEGRARKLATVRAKLVAKQADGLLLASLDDIAWLLNIRGGDIANSPVVQAFAFVGLRRAFLFVDPSQLPRPLVQKLAAAGVACRPYDSLRAFLKGLTSLKAVVLNPRRVSQSIVEALPTKVAIREETIDITTELKAVKNPVEQGHFRHAALVDGLALVRFFAWLERRLAAGTVVSEHDAIVQLAEFRKMAPEYRADSFAAICAYGSNAAMVHYTATQAAAARLRRKGMLLVDSGGNYFEGTMDTTRTMSLGPVSHHSRRDYTVVLQGLIAFSRLRFAKGTTGTHLDAVVRAPLWAHGVNFKHGCGHGVGFYLNVHEGPHGITPTWSPAVLKPGMVVTIEPGAYVEGSHGIRTENMVMVREAGTTGYGEFLEFETLTVCPIDTVPLLLERMTREEKQWLNTYHRTVWKRLSPHLSGEDRQWLAAKCAPLPL